MDEIENQYDPGIITLPLTLLILVNLLPIFALIFWGWKVSELIVLYWAEDIVVGFYNAVKMKCAKLPAPAVKIKPTSAIMTFIFSYGIFIIVHGIIVWFILLSNAAEKNGSAVDKIHSVIYSPILLLGIALLFFSHGVSFYVNFIKNHEREFVSDHDLILQPFKRVFTMQVVITIAAAIASGLGSPIGLLVLIVILKIGLDIWHHKKEHQVIATRLSGTYRRHKDYLELFGDDQQLIKK